MRPNAFSTILITMLLALAAPDRCYAQLHNFGAHVRHFYADTLKQYTPDIKMTETSLIWKLQEPLGQCADLSALEYACIEQARIEAIRLYRMNTPERIKNWAIAIPKIEIQIQKLLAIAIKTKGRTLNPNERQEVDAIRAGIFTTYKDFFADVAAGVNRTAEQPPNPCQAYFISIYSIPAGAFAEEVDLGTYQLHMHYNWEIPWKTVQFGRFSHQSYGQVQFRYRWPGQPQFTMVNWRYVSGRVYELTPAGLKNAGDDATYKHP